MVVVGVVVLELAICHFGYGVQRHQVCESCVVDEDGDRHLGLLQQEEKGLV